MQLMCPSRIVVVSGLVLLRILDNLSKDLLRKRVKDEEVFAINLTLLASCACCEHIRALLHIYESY
jgi:hypothetical protein